MSKRVKDLDSRLERLEGALTLANTGTFDIDVEVSDELDFDDPLTAVETGVYVLINDMGEQVMESRKRSQELQDKLNLIEKQRQAIEELSTPIIKIWDQVLVLPLIGTLDTRRSQKLTEALLTDISATQTKVTIIDITGVPNVDSAVANHLLKTVAAVQLLGASCVITGIRPEVAQTIVHLGVDLGGVETLSNLAEGLQWALNRLKYRILKEEGVQ
ncbi:STAS domain-containing protein [candidate division WOR-3 bacterium]|nr:STAS domain-containing protein [candidate division WOR-3 bacterium]